MCKLVLIAAFIGIALGAVPRRPHHNFSIIGGEPTDISKHPWQFTLDDDENFQFCSGFLISDVWAVTAAHCCHYDSYVIRVGSSFQNRSGETIQVKECITHSQFSLETHDNDIALLRLLKPVTNPIAKPAILPQQGEAVEDKVLVTLVGWGDITMNGPSSDQLLQVQVPTVSHDDCQKAYDGNATITENMICAGLLGVGGKDTCHGDSGGPVELDGKVVAIVSWGFGCADPRWPGVYTKVSNYIDWIKSKTGLNL